MSLKQPKVKRNFYNYLLVDTRDLVSLISCRSLFKLGEIEPNFRDYCIFKKNIFYVGKGSSYRMNMHLKNAKKLFLGYPSKKGFGNNQEHRIVNCWRTGGSVMVVQLDQWATHFKAHCREAALISALGLQNVYTLIKGSIYGDMRLWSKTKLNNFGEMTLYLTFRKFLLKRPPLIGPGDVFIRPQ